MILCFSCTPAARAALDNLIAGGHYADDSQAINTAISNLAVLHRELGSATSIMVGAEGRVGTGDADAEGSNGLPEVLLRRDQRPRQMPEAPAEPAGVQYIFSRPAKDTPPDDLASATADSRSLTNPIYLDDWIFGQFNRLLPVKATCRALANYMARGDGPQQLDKLGLEIANRAAEFGEHLTKLDARRNLHRDDWFAVAFPKYPSLDGSKSARRFASQFVGSTNKEGQLHGLPGSLKLVALASGRLVLTGAGWTFGAMANPVIDGVKAGPLAKLSDDEISFLIEHIVASVPVEAHAYRTVLGEIMSGRTTPEGLDQALAKLSKTGREAGNPFISTQRSGVVARMSDLDLVSRSRTGTRVAYVITPRGKAFLQANQ